MQGNKKSDNFFHNPALVNEVMTIIKPASDGCYLDCTLGGGGHALQVLRISEPRGRLIGIDCDLDAINYCKEKFADYRKRFKLVLTNFKYIKNLLKVEFEGIIFDLGVSSFQLNSSDRGFSFQLNGLLDMRMDKTLSITAWDLINSSTMEKLVKIFSEKGEERSAIKIAKEIIDFRRKKRIDTTLELAGIMERVIRGQRKKKH